MVKSILRFWQAPDSPKKTAIALNGSRRFSAHVECGGLVTAKASFAK
jgi:hypothetical protein